jgi:hypothetical protein
MAFDRREAILQRLFIVMQTIDGVRSVYRNQPQVSAHQRPAIVILDGDETGTEGQFALGRPPSTPGIFAMTPEIYLTVAGGAADVGTDLNTLRLQVIGAVLGDAELLSFVGTVGGIQYQGCFTDLGRGRALEGEMGMTFSFHYPLYRAEF